ncbi:pitrilysin family protein [soil metagenome]
MQKIHKKILNNGLTILVYPLHTIPKVAVQLWYGVGSKDEKDGQRGLAHLLEHMIFKGTSVLSESDINMISHKLSGNCNAFTSHDYTGYLFDFPKQNWHNALSLLADCMRNCTFKEDLLNAELKAVIQELKMYKDDYKTSLAEEMLSAIFQEHPYHYPIIGYKQDLWSINREGLLSFYRQHYVPNNGTLIIVGDVDAEAAFDLAATAFENIKADATYIPEQFAFSSDICSREVTVRRDVQQPSLMYAWVVPGLKQQKNYITDIASWILGEGKGSRLYRKLVDELELATDLQVDLYELFDANILFLHVDPMDEEGIAAIEEIIKTEIINLATVPVSDDELIRAHKQSHVEHIGLFESNQKIAYELGKIFLATKNENAIFEYPELNSAALKKEVQEFFASYIRPSIMQKGALLPFIGKQQEEWLLLQEQADKLDQVILSRKVRESTVECGVFVEQVVVNEATSFSYPKAAKIELENGLELLTYNQPITPKIDIMLDLKVRNFYDPEDKQGLLNFMIEMLGEGTQDYTDQEFSDAAEARGISINVQTGLISVSMLKEDFEFGLSLLEQLLCKPTFPEKNIAKIRQQIAAEIAHFWDSPSDFAGQLVRSSLYGKDHPYHKNLFGTLESIKKIKREDILQAYKKYITPHQAAMAIVGDLEGIDVAEITQRVLGNWQGDEVEDLFYPALEVIHNKTVVHPINRDQTVLCFAGRSVGRLDKDYDALLLFDQVFTAGVLGSMNSYLFKLREQTGLFYSIGGSLVAGADEQPGLVFIKTMVSNDRLDEAEKLIAQTIDGAKNMLTQEDLDHARNAIINTTVDNFESNDTTAQALLFVNRFKLKPTYFDDRIASLKQITVEEVKNSVGMLLDSHKLIRIKIGRVD